MLYWPMLIVSFLGLFLIMPLSLSSISFLFQVIMSFLIWNCSGTGKMYNLDFMAILEPRVSGEKVDFVINKVAMDGIACVEACGFSGGIWCLCKITRFSISVMFTSRYCIHLKVNPNSASPWILFVVYARLQQGLREFLLLATRFLVLGVWLGI